MIIFTSNRDGTRVRNMIIDHKLCDTLARQRFEKVLTRDKRQSETAASSTDKRQRKATGWKAGLAAAGETSGEQAARLPDPATGNWKQ